MADPDPVYESPKTLYVTIFDFADGTAQVVTHRYMEGAKTGLSLTPFTRYERGDVADEHKRQRDQAVNALKRIVGKNGGFQWSADIHREAAAAILEGEGNE